MIPVGLVLAFWTAVNGIHLRIFGDLWQVADLPLHQVEFPDSPSREGWSLQIQEDPQIFAWPLVVIGMSWPGAISAFLFKYRWGYRSVMLLGGLSVLMFGIGTILAILSLLLLLAPSTRRWWKMPRDVHAR
jgi:hypothetical protein